MLLGLYQTDTADTLGRAQAAPAAEIPPTFSESYHAAFAETRAYANSDALWRARHEVVQAALDRLEDATGEVYANPEAASRGPNRDALEKSIRARFDSLKAERPDLDLAYPTDEEIQAGAVEKARKAKGERDALAAKPGDFASGAGFLLGDIAGAMTDPLNIASMFAGAPAGAGILKTAAIEAGIAATSQAVIEAGTAGFKRQVDPEYGLGEAAGNIAAAGAGGAIIGGGLRAAGRALDWWRGRDRSELPREMQDALNVTERDQEVRAANPLGPGVAAEQAHAGALQKAAQDIEAGRPVDVQDIVQEAVPSVENGGLVPLDPRTVGVDAETFQYKAGGDDAGVTDRLRGVTEWRPERAGVSIVYERADGSRVVADGHQRRGLALRILEQGDGQEPRLNSVIYREAEGWAPEQVRALAAAKNIAEGTGSPLDAAKVLRDGDPSIVRSLPPTSALVRDAKGLAHLEGEPFGMVVNGVVPEQYGAIVGRLVTDGPMQRDVMGLLAKLQPANRTEAEAIVRQAMEAGSAERAASSQGSLFGDDVVQESLFLERARVLDRALKVLRRDRTVFGTLTAEADRITGAGNILDSASNLARADADGAAIQTLTTLANRKGALSDALSTSARRAREDGRYDAAVRDFVEAARREAAGASSPPPKTVREEGRDFTVVRRVTPDELRNRGPVAVTEASAQWADLPWKDARAAARQWARENLRDAPLTNADTGWGDIAVSRKGIEKSIASAKMPADLEVLPNLRELMDRAVFVESNKGGADSPDVVAFHRLYAPFRLADTLYRAKLTVKETTDGRLFYEPVLTEIERPGVTTKPESPLREGASLRPPGPSTIDMDGLLEGVKFRGGEPVLPPREDADLFGSLAPAARPADEVAAAPEVEPALFQEVNRLMASRELDVPVGEVVDESGRVVAVHRSAMDLMDEADRAINDAATVAACAFGEVMK